MTCPSCGHDGLPPLVCEHCGHRWYATPAPLDFVPLATQVAVTRWEIDVERLARAIDAVEEGGVRNGVFERLTTIDNGRLARAIAHEYAALSDRATSTDKETP